MELDVTKLLESQEELKHTQKLVDSGEASNFTNAFMGITKIVCDDFKCDKLN